MIAEIIHHLTIFQNNVAMMAEEGEEADGGVNTRSSRRPSLPTTQRLVVGLLTLILVDIIWVASSELTKFIFKEQNYSKPFFSTYLKTSLFMLYLPGFLIYKPWRDQCQLGLRLQRLPRRDLGGDGGLYTAVQVNTRLLCGKDFSSLYLNTFPSLKPNDNC